MPTPLELSLSAPRARTIAGEGVVLDLEVHVLAALELHDVVLNRDRTTVTLARLEPPGPEEVLTGADHARLYEVPALAQLGRPFKAPAGARWTDPLELGLYRRPLPPGRYRVAVAYRHGATPDAVARSNAVELEVVPAVTTAYATRWHAGGNPRATLAGLRTAKADGPPRLYYHAAPGTDPGLFPVAVDLGPAPTPDPGPSLAHLNHIASFSFERWAAWATARGVGWQRFQKRGPLGAPGEAPHGLDATPPPRLVDPPLHTHPGDRLLTLVEGRAGGAPERALVEVDPDGTSRRTALPGDDLERTVVAWQAHSPPRLHIFGLSPAAAPGRTRLVRVALPGDERRTVAELEGAVLALAVEPWLGEGAVAALTSAPAEDEEGVDLLRVVAWRGVAPEAPPAGARTHRVGRPFDLVEVQPVPGGADLVVLGRVAAGWLVLGPDGRAVVPLLEGGEPRPPRLVVGADADAGQRRVWLVRWTPEGPLVTRPTWER